MKKQNDGWKKRVKVSMAGTIAIAPVMIGISIAQAAPQSYSQTTVYRRRIVYLTITGRVTSVQSNSRFNVEVGNTEYNVYLSTSAPRRLDKGDIVRVYGRRYGNNDVRNASVAIIRNTPGNGAGQWGDFQTFTGRVTSVESNSRFNIQVGGREYNVYLSASAPRRLDKGDTVRVYGRRYGNNDIRNANVSIINNTPGNGSGQWGGFATFTGIAGKVQDQRFRLKVGGTTYDVYASTRLPARLDTGDRVRVYGRRYGENDIRNATVVVIRNR